MTPLLILSSFLLFLLSRPFRFSGNFSLSLVNFPHCGRYFLCPPILLHFLSPLFFGGFVIRRASVTLVGVFFSSRFSFCDSIPWAIPWVPFYTLRPPSFLLWRNENFVPFFSFFPWYTLSLCRGALSMSFGNRQSWSISFGLFFSPQNLPPHFPFFINSHPSLSPSLIPLWFICFLSVFVIACEHCLRGFLPDPYWLSPLPLISWYLEFFFDSYSAWGAEGEFLFYFFF